MSSTIGTFFLVATLVCNIFAFVGYGLSLFLKSKVLVRNARWLNIASIAFTLSAFITLQVALFNRDYSLLYVYEHTANTIGTLFTFTSAWAGLEGSLLLWALVQGGFSGYVLFATRNKTTNGESKSGFDETSVIAQMVLVFFVIFFVTMILAVASPFEKAAEIANNGLGANPLLQEHFAMAIHPPLLYIGYIGFTVPFAYMVAALIKKDFSNLSTTRVRRSSMIAWTFLTAGIILGAWWSYEVLGWGGYWAWDPVENASLLPWLTATAFLHSTIVEHKRQMLRGWNATVVIATCALTIFGTFLTRSGVVNSVHAFTQSHVGGWLLTLFAIIVLGGAGLLVWRYDEVRSPRSLKGASKKETMFLLNNVLFCVFTLVVLLGTTYPMIADTLRGEQISVGTPYYEKFAGPIGLAILILMGIAPMVAFAETKVAINERLRLPAIYAVLFFLIGLLLDQSFVTSIAMGSSTFVVVGSVLILIKTFKQSGKRTLIERPRKVGAMIAHMGIAFIGISIVLSSNTWAKEATLVKGKPQQVGPYTLTYVKDVTTSTEDIVTNKVDIKIVRGEKVLGTYAPKVRTYPARNMSVGTPSVHTSFVRDTYLTLISSPSEDKVVIKIAQNPAVLYIWLSGIMIVAGGAICLIPQRRKADEIAAKKKAEKVEV